MSESASSIRSGSGFVRAAYFFHLLELAERWQIPRDSLVEGLGLQLNQSWVPDRRISLRQAHILAWRLLASSGRHELGMEFGFSVKPTSHGALGHAFMCSGTFGEAVSLLRQYRSL